MNRKVTVVVRIKAKPGVNAQVKQELLHLLAPTRSEKGCINYDMHRAVDDDALFLFHENWTCEEDLRRHLESPHVQNWLRRADELLAEPMEMTRWEQVG